MLHIDSSVAATVDSPVQVTADEVFWLAEKPGNLPNGTTTPRIFGMFA